MYRIGIIGCGKIAQVRHISEYLASDKAEIVALYDLNAERTKQLAEKLNAKACSSVDELLGEKLDAVSVCTANHTHAEYAVKALMAGVNVLCEKPMATSLADCQKMVDVAKNNGKILMIGQNQRLTAAHKRAKALIKEGRLGRVLSFRTSFGHGGPETWSVDPGAATWFFDRKRAVMGAMADLGIHKTDLINYILDDEIVAVTAKLATLDKKDASGALIGVDDNAFCIYEMKSGAIGTMTASWTNYAGEDNSTIIYGTEGVMKIYCTPEWSIVLELKDGTKECYQLDAIQTNDNQTSSGVIDCFLASLEEGKCDIDGESVIKAMKAVFGAIESSEKGMRVEIF